jgi:hypothetical protein
VNPVTRALMQQIEDRGLHAFVDAWDELEVLIVEIYKAGGADGSQQAEFADILAHLTASYPDWQSALEAHWRATTIKGRPLAADPFQALMDLEDAGAVVDNWGAMQTLPAAREALNNMLVERIGNSRDQ